MAVTETARRNHDELFPDRISTLAQTDPELIECFDNLAFDDVLRQSTLDTRTRLMVQLAALIGGQALSEYRVALGAALTAGVTPVEVREIVYQAIPYGGMGKVFDFIHATNDVLTERGIQLPLDGQSTTTPVTRAEKGRAVREQITGQTGRSRCTRRQPRTRCASSGSCPPTASATTTPAAGSTCRCASCSPSRCWLLSAGATPRSRATWRPTSTSATAWHALISVTTVLLPFIGYPRTLNAIAAVNEVAPASKE
jgi:4-carboxymuconolactone decarboxylase